MPTTPARARRWLKSGKATSFWKGGLFCVRLNVEPQAQATQPIAVGIDPGSKREGSSVISAAHTYLNIQADARTGVQETEQQSTRMRRTRRNRKTPCRQPRQNRHHARRCVPPATLARRQLHRLQAERAGKRKPYGGTLSQGLKRGTLVKHPKWGKTYVGGQLSGRVSLHDPQTGKRLTQAAKVTDCRVIKLLRWRTRLV